MKKITLLKSMLLLCALVVGSTSLWAKHVPYLTLTFPDDNSSKNGLTTKQYESTWTAKSGDYVWSISNFNNNNWGGDWKYIKCGRKQVDSENTPSIATITTSSPIDKLVMEVVVSLSAIDNSDYNSIKMYVASDEDFESNLQTVNATIPTGGGDLVFSVPSPATGQYYKLEFNTKGGTSKNGHTVITQVAYCASPEADGPELAAINTTPTTWNLTSSIVGAFTKNTKSCRVENTLQATDGKSNITYMQGKSDELMSTYLKAGGKSTFGTGNDPRYFVLHITKSGVLTITSNDASGKQGNYLIYQSKTDDITAAVKTKTITTSAERLTAAGGIDITDGEYLYIGWEGTLYTESLSWAEADGISLTTTTNMDGWRTFYESTTQNYEVDANTTIYTVASKTGESNTVELTAASGKIIPGKTPVILKTTAGDHKIVLTKTETDANLGSNLLAAATGSSAIDGYRLGFGSIGVGFYKYAGTPAAGTVYIDSGNVTTSARELGIGFGDDVTAINKVEAKKVENRVFFNLAGQQVAQPTKGLYIVDGRKVVIK